MIEAISSNELIAELFATSYRQASAPQTVAPQRATDTSQQSNLNEFAQPVDEVNLSIQSQPVRQSAQGHNSANTKASSDQSLSSQEDQKVSKLKRRDQEVRRHEKAHQAAAGSHSKGGARFEYETGPDGKRYAIGGEVSIDTSAVQGNPKATIAKMQQIKRAALAPANPSSQDRSVAAKASAAEQQARAELAQDRSTIPGPTAGNTRKEAGSEFTSVNSSNTGVFRESDEVMNAYDRFGANQSGIILELLI